MASVARPTPCIRRSRIDARVDSDDLLVARDSGGEDGLDRRGVALPFLHPQLAHLSRQRIPPPAEHLRRVLAPAFLLALGGFRRLGEFTLQPDGPPTFRLWWQP